MRPDIVRLWQAVNEFQSTHSLRSATSACILSAYHSMFQSTHSLRSATISFMNVLWINQVSIHALLAECDSCTPSGFPFNSVSIHALLAECDQYQFHKGSQAGSFNPRTPCGVRQSVSNCLITIYPFQSTHSLRSATPAGGKSPRPLPFQSTHSLRSATAPNLIHCYSTKQIILCANLPKKTVIARLLFLSIYLSIFYSQCITPIADLPGNSCELEVGAQAMFNSL